VSAQDDERSFEKAADATLAALETSLSGSGLDLEVELSLGVLTIELPDGAKYVINSHRAARQIWMAAERTAWHFDRDPSGKWVAAKSGDELLATVNAVLSKKLGRAVAL
jgi:CyaY protein